MKSSYIFALCLLAAAAAPACGKTIEIGAGQGGWSLGIEYFPIDAEVGDALVFKYTGGAHDVWSLTEPTCDFEAPGAKELASAAVTSYTTTLTTAGTFYYSCSIVGHCEAGMLLTVNVKAAGEAAAAAPSTAPPTTPSTSSPPTGATIQGGTCSEPVVDPTTGVTTVSCLSPAVSLKPGDNRYPNVELPNPYPLDKEVAVQSLSADVVDSTGRVMPLNEIYLHHNFGDVRFIPGEGAELRRSPLRETLPDGYRMFVNGSDFVDGTRFSNLHLINTIGVAPEDLKACIECWCEDTNPPVGSIGCCKACPSTESSAPAQDYFFVFNATYVPVTAEIKATTKPVTFVALDIHGGVDYSVPPGEGPDAVDVTTREYPLDYFCPQDGDFYVVKCWAHQHNGAKGITMYDSETGTKICESFPTTGTEAGVPGNEEGYLVGMSATTYDNSTAEKAPYRLKAGQKVRFEAVYDATEPYAGVMSVMALAFDNFTARPECNINFAAFIQPPKGDAKTDVATLIDESEKRIEAVPARCTQIKSYLDGVVTPCLPLAAANLSGGSENMAEMATCCDGVNDTGLESVLTAVVSSGDDKGCICPLGDLLLYAVREDLLGAITQIAGMCTGDSTADGIGGNDGAIFIALNSFFAPRCPELAEALSTLEQAPSASSSNSTSAIAPSGSGGSSEQVVAQAGDTDDAAAAPAQGGSMKLMSSGVVVALMSLLAVFG